MLGRGRALSAMEAVRETLGERRGQKAEAGNGGKWR